MKLNKTLIPIGTLAIALATGAVPANAAEHGDRRDRGGEHERQGAPHQRGDGERGRAAPERGGGGGRDSARVAPDRRGESDRGGPAASQRNGFDRGRPEFDRGRPNVDRGRPNFDRGRENNAREFRGVPERRDFDRGRLFDRREGYGYSHGGPRFIPGRAAPRHFYGPGGNWSAYFGWGSGYLYGAPYSGRVYGYITPGPNYGGRVAYGDVRLQLSPRDAAVYVDGYYAGIVDDFDGRFQRLTLTVGPHQIEVEADGCEPQTFDVYVDPARTVDLQGELYPDRR
jgi:hypothetical protein